MYASYVLSVDEAEKLINGHAVHFAEDEQHNLMLNIPLYYRNIAEQLYKQPFDESLVEKALAAPRQSDYVLAA
jgi:hypothetical protein